MCSIKNVVLKSLTTEEMNKYKCPKKTAVSGKDKEKEYVRIEKWEELACLPTSKDWGYSFKKKKVKTEVIQDLSLPTESSMEV